MTTFAPIQLGLTPAGRASYFLPRGGEADVRGDEPSAGGGCAGAPLALLRRGAGRGGRGDRRHDDRAAADAAAGSADLRQHRHRRRAAAGRDLRQRRAEDRDVPDVAAADHVVPAGAGGVGDAPHPAARRRGRGDPRVRQLRRGRQPRGRRGGVPDPDDDPVHRDLQRLGARRRGGGALHAGRDARQADVDRRGAARRPHRPQRGPPAARGAGA